MGAIGVSERDGWVVARWVFRGYLDHVLAELHDDPELTSVVEQAIALDGLHLPLRQPAVVRRLAPVLQQVAEEVVSGARPVIGVDGRALDESYQQGFRRAVAELRAILAAVSPGDPERPET
jgi:hypothetical protein